MLTILATLLWMPGALWLSHRTCLGEVACQGRQPLSHANWSGVIMLVPRPYLARLSLRPVDQAELRPEEGRFR